MKNIFLILCVSLLVACSTNSKNKKAKAELLNTIQGTWIVSEIKNISKEELSNYKKTPFIKFEEEKVSGHNGCNNYFSSINNITEKSIEFSVFGETKMMCPEMKISDAFGLLLANIISYSADEKTLTFFNAKGKQILVFTKA